MRASIIGFCVFALGALSLAASPVALAADGYAGANGGTTGGAGGATVTVTNATDFISYAEDTHQDPYIIQVSGNIDLGSSNVRVRGNKTVIGLAGSHIAGNLKCYGAEESNNIFQNLDMDNYNDVGDGDCITLDGVQHIWIDHCTFTDGGDGNVDVKNGAEWITVSWSIFQYTYNSGHNFSNLIGHSDSNGSKDRGKLHVTFHHCWWSTLAVERMPRTRFGKIHSFNNYFSCTGNNYCIRACLESETLVENCYFDHVDQPWEYYTLTGQIPGKVRSVNNVFDTCTGIVAGNDTVFTPPYSYTLDAAADVPAIVMAYAGFGKIGSEDDLDPPTPDPMTWDVAPNALGEDSIAMTATTASDPSGVQYYFANLTAPSHDSGWQFGTSYTDTGLDPSTEYTYTVKARDLSANNNETTPSSPASATTGAPDTTPPSPNPLSYRTRPHAVGPTSIAMTATTATDPSGVEYYFTNLTVSGHDSGWQDGPIYTDQGLAPSTEYTYRAKARDKSPSQNETGQTGARSATTDDVPPFGDPLAYWRLNETSGGVAHDLSGNGNDATLENMNDSAWVGGKYGNALQFDGTDDRARVPHSDSIDFGYEDFTVCFWLKQTSASAETQYIVKGTVGDSSDPGSGKRYQIYYKSSQVRFAIDDGANKPQINAASSNFITGAWVHVAAVRDTLADEIRLYANGTLVGSAEDTAGSISQTEALCIGQANLLGSFTPFNGQIDEVRIYDSVLSAEQIASVASGEFVPPTPTPEPLSVSAERWMLY